MHQPELEDELIVKIRFLSANSGGLMKVDEFSIFVSLQNLLYFFLKKNIESHQKATSPMKVHFDYGKLLDFFFFGDSLNLSVLNKNQFNTKRQKLLHTKITGLFGNITERSKSVFQLF